MAVQKQVVAVGRQIAGKRSAQVDPAYRAKQQTAAKVAGK